MIFSALETLKADAWPAVSERADAIGGYADEVSLDLMIARRQKYSDRITGNHISHSRAGPTDSCITAALERKDPDTIWD